MRPMTHIGTERYHSALTDKPMEASASIWVLCNASSMSKHLGGLGELPRPLRECRKAFHKRLKEDERYRFCI